MNPIFKWIVAHSTGKLATRTCSKCGNVQQVPIDKAAMSMTCARCGAPLPPAPRA